MPEKKECVTVSKGVHKKNFETCKSLCNVQELFPVFKEQYPNVNIWFSKFSALRPKWCVCSDQNVDTQKPDQIKFFCLKYFH